MSDFGIRTMNDVVSRLSNIYGVAQKQGNSVSSSVLGYGALGSDYAASPSFQWMKVDSSGQLYVNTIAGTVSQNLTQVGGAAITLGQKTMANSFPVAIASDQSAVPASQSGTWTVQQGTPPWSVSQSGTWNIGTVTTVTTLSQFPSTAALADTTANPTLTQIQVFPMGFNGSAWDRTRGATAFNNNAIPTAATGMQMTAIAGGSILTGAGDYAVISVIKTQQDALSNTAVFAMATVSELMAFNGTTWDRLRTSSTGTGILATLAPNRSTFATGQQNVTTAGTPVNLSAQAIPDGKALLLRAKASNTKNISVGNSSANATYTNNTGDILTPGSVLQLYITNTNLIWIDSQVNGEGISYAVET